ncbi:MAG: HDOD domain-containing protein [Gammaproteobacteria bacterium]|nr:HDOD domain-containing protein [Gammaproteobacteria bacterium]
MSSPLNLIMPGDQVPALAMGMPELLKAMTDETIGFREITEIISRYPDISSRLLFLSNSAWAAPVVPVSSIVVACSTLGLSVVRGISLALSIATPFNPMRCNGFDSHRFWLSALMVADTAKLLATKSRSIGSELLATIHTAGIIHNIGMLWLADRLPLQTSAALHESLLDPTVSVNDGLLKHCGMSYPMVSGRLSQVWGFPDILTATLLYHNDTDYHGPYADIAATVGFAARLVDYALEGNTLKTFDDERIDRLGLQADQLDTIIARLTDKLEDSSKMVEAFLSAA